MNQDVRMDEIDEERQYWQDEIDRLKELRDNSEQIQASMDNVLELLKQRQRRLPEIDQPPDGLKKLPLGKQKEILLERQKMIRALCEWILIYADGRIIIEGLVGDELLHFEKPTSNDQ